MRDVVRDRYLELNEDDELDEMEMEGEGNYDDNSQQPNTVVHDGQQEY